MRSIGSKIDTGKYYPGFPDSFMKLLGTLAIVCLVSCVDVSLLARINLTFLQIGRVQSCVRSVDAALIDGRWP